MLKDSPAFSGFSVKNLDETKRFYSQVLGLEVTQDTMGLKLFTAHNSPTFIYLKEDHKPADFTILNFPVENIDKTIDELVSKGIEFKQYDLGNGAKTDAKGVLRGLSANMGPDIAWFEDPSGNVLSILQDK
jgi:catechol 2,3-dioxygenase-like lactoylglutathione lyase family enzyme